jgi:hypothetical protein
MLGQFNAGYFTFPDESGQLCDGLVVQGRKRHDLSSFPNWKPIRALLISGWALIIITIKARQSFLLIADALYLFKVI